MGCRKKVLSAGIVQSIMFPSMGDRNLYLKSLDGRKINYELVSTQELSDGSVIIRIVKQYNSCDLIKL